MELISNDELTLDIIESGCVTWEDLVRSVRNFKYSRSENRGDFTSVWYRRVGTCSTKHGFLYQVARQNNFEAVQLIVGIYLMTGSNTPKVKPVLEKYQLDGIPEAHCYLKVGEEYLDATSNYSSFESIAEDVMNERVVESEFLIADKIQHHKKFMKSWRTLVSAPYSDEELWKIREECIAALSAD